MKEVVGEKDYTIDGSIPVDEQPLGRFGREEELAGTVLYYASRAGSYCSGSIHLIDGGFLGQQPGSSY